MNLGFVGLGAMGQVIVPRLIAAGHTVTGWNRTRARAEPLIKLGMRVADTPRAVAENSEIVFSIVTDSKALRAVALGADGVVSGLRKGGIFIDMSTIEPDASRAEIAQALERAQANDFIARQSDGLTAMIGERGRSLSGGERQRLTIARAVLKDPPIMIFDEASSALDAETEPTVRLRQWCIEHGVGALNVAGSRESKAHGIQERVRDIVVTALRR